MPDRLLPISCPKCHHDSARLFINSKTVITVQCARCDHEWVVDLTAVPEAVRKQVPPYAMHHD